MPACLHRSYRNSPFADLSKRNNRYLALRIFCDCVLGCSIEAIRGKQFKKGRIIKGC